MRKRTGPQISPLMTAWFATCTSTVSSRVSPPRRSRQAFGNVRYAAPVSTRASQRMLKVASVPFSIVVSTLMRPMEPSRTNQCSAELGPWWVAVHTMSLRLVPGNLSPSA